MSLQTEHLKEIIRELTASVATWAPVQEAHARALRDEAFSLIADIEDDWRWWDAENQRLEHIVETVREIIRDADLQESDLAHAS